MEFSEKHILVPLNRKMNNECKPLLLKAIELYKLGKLNDELNILIAGEFRPNTNVIDYLLDSENKLPYSKEFKLDLVNATKPYKNDEIYTKLSPFNFKNGRKVQNKKWIT